MRTGFEGRTLHLQAETREEQRILSYISQLVPASTWTRDLTVDGLAADLAGTGYDPGAQALRVTRPMRWDYFKGLNGSRNAEAAIRGQGPAS